MSLSADKMQREIERFLSLTTRRHWEKALDSIEKTSGYFYKSYLYNRNPLIQAITHYTELSKKGKSIRKNINEKIRFLASISYLFNFLYRNLGNNCENMLLGRIKSDDVRSFLFELEIITNFFRIGANIDFVDYQNTIGSKIYDFLILNGNKGFEVECKYKDYDSRQYLTRPALYSLSDIIIQDIDVGNYNCIVSVEFKKDLPSNFNIQKSLASEIKSKLNGRSWSKEEHDFYFIEIIPINYGHLLDTPEKVVKFIQPYYSGNSHLMSLSSKTNNFFIKYSTLQERSITEGIYQSLKDAANQLSKKRAGIICCYIEGINPEEWNMLKDKGGLFDMAKHYLLKEKNNLIHSLIFSSKPEAFSGTFGYDMKTPTLSFKNPNTIFYNNYETKDLIEM